MANSEFTMTFHRSGSGTSPPARENLAENRVHERIQGWENRLEESRQLGAGFEQERHTPFVNAMDQFDQRNLQQREDAIHQLWFQSAREKILKIDRLEKENQSLRDQITYSGAVYEEVEELTEQLEERNAEIDEFLAEKQLVVEPYLEELETKIDSLTARKNELSIKVALRDQAIEALALENESLRKQLQHAHRADGLGTDQNESRMNDRVANKKSDASDTKVKIEKVEQPSAAKREQDLELKNTKRLLSIAQDDLRNARSELEIADHHLQLRRESITAMEATRRKSSAIGLSLFEAEAYVRNDLEIQRDNLESELEDVRTRKQDLDYHIERLRFDLMNSNDDKEELQKAVTDAKIQCSHLATERSNLQVSLETLRRCFESATEEAQEKDAQIIEFKCELHRQNGMIMTLSGALHTAQRKQNEELAELKQQSTISRIRGELLQQERKNHVDKKLELERANAQLEKLRTDLDRAHATRRDGFDETLGENRFFERQLTKAEETVRQLKMQLDVTQNQLSRERELRDQRGESSRFQISNFERQDSFQSQMSISGNRNGVVGSAPLGDALNGMLGKPSEH